MRVEITYKMVTTVIQYFCFPDKPMKGGDILDFQKGGILEKGGLIQKKGGGVWPPFPTMSDN